MASGQRTEPLGLYRRTRRGAGSIFLDHVSGTFAVNGPVGVPGATGGPLDLKVNAGSDLLDYYGFVAARR